MLPQLRRLAITAAIVPIAALAQQVDLPVEVWDRPALSSPDWESHPAIDPRTGDVWLVRSDKNFSGWRLMVAQCRDGRLSAPGPAPLAAPGLEADPWFSPDGMTLWFISSRASGAMESKGLDIWHARRREDGSWNEPERLPEPVNSGEAEWFPRPGPDGWLYFGSRRGGGLGKDDIWRAKQDAGGAWLVENAGSGLNSPEAEYEFQPSSDGRWGILATETGLYMVSRENGDWKRLYRFGQTVNANGSEIGPAIIADGRAFLFSRDLGGGRSGEIMVAWLSGGRPAGDATKCGPAGPARR